MSARTHLAAAALAALVGLAATPRVGLAASRPHFARAYAGTINGHAETRSDDLIYRETWDITGVHLRLAQVQSSEGGRNAIYKLTGGAISFNANETGVCSYSIAKNYDLPGDLPHSPSVPFALVEDPLGHLTMLGTIELRPKLTVTEVCGEHSYEKPFTLPNFFDPFEAHWQPRHRLVHTFRLHSGPETVVWSWDLQPSG